MGSAGKSHENIIFCFPWLDSSWLDRWLFWSKQNILQVWGRKKKINNPVNLFVSWFSVFTEPFSIDSFKPIKLSTLNDSVETQSWLNLEPAPFSLGWCKTEDWEKTTKLLQTLLTLLQQYIANFQQRPSYKILHFQNTFCKSSNNCYSTSVPLHPQMQNRTIPWQTSSGLTTFKRCSSFPVWKVKKERSEVQWVPMQSGVCCVGAHLYYDNKHHPLWPKGNEKRPFETQ